ncbi:MAG: hypothetical protein KY462_11230 [Actinobacteria bacterium]|nr:hypothetical protein [Actinomycetota bacterium]
MLATIRERTSPEDGVTLVELLWATVILAVVLAAMAASSVASIAGTTSANGQVAANQFANEVVERIRDERWTTLVPTGTPVNPSYPAVVRKGVTYTPTVALTWVNDPCNGSAITATTDGTKDYLRVDVTVTWVIKDKTRTLNVQTFRTPTPAELKPHRVEVLTCA